MHNLLQFTRLTRLSGCGKRLVALTTNNLLQLTRLSGYEKRFVTCSPIVKRVQIAQEVNISKLKFRNSP